MQRRLAGTVGVWIMACAVVVAADFWTDKDFMSWSDREVEKMLTDSPWSRQVTVVLSVMERPGTGRIGGSGRDGLWDPSVAEAADLASRGAGLPSSLANSVSRATLTVSWIRALPVKQALVRRRIGMNAAIPPAGQELLWQVEPYYVVAVSELPQSFWARSQDVPAVLAATALKRRHQDPIAPDSVQFFRNDPDRSIQAVYVFPKTDAITLVDQEVDFVTTLSGIDIKKKFKLEDMVLGDQLVL